LSDQYSIAVSNLPLMATRLASLVVKKNN